MYSKEEKNKLREILAKHSDGESLSDAEYEMLTNYWVIASNIVEIYPSAFGHGTLHYVINKADECSSCLKRRNERKRSNAKGDI